MTADGDKKWKSIETCERYNKPEAEYSIECITHSGHWPGSRDLTASSTTYLLGSVGFNDFILKLGYFAFNIWLGIAYLGGKFWGFWVKIGKGIFVFRPQPKISSYVSDIKGSCQIS